MTRKERVSLALSRQNTDMTPYNIELTSGAMKIFTEKYGITKWEESNPLQFISTNNGAVIDREEINETLYGTIEPQKNKMRFVWDRYFVYARSLKINKEEFISPDCEHLLNIYAEKCILSDENPKGSIMYYEKRIRELQEGKDWLEGQYLNYKKLYEEKRGWRIWRWLRKNHLRN